GRGGGELGIAGGDRAGDRGVLLSRGREPGGGVAGQAAQSPEVQAQPAQRVGEVGVAAGGVEGGIELFGQGVVRGGVGARCELGGGLIEPGSEVREERAETGAAGGCGVLVAVGAGGGAGVVCGALGGAARGEGLQGDAEVEEVGCLVEGHGGDD